MPGGTEPATERVSICTTIKARKTHRRDKRGLVPLAKRIRVNALHSVERDQERPDAGEAPRRQRAADEDGGEEPGVVQRGLGPWRVGCVHERSREDRGLPRAAREDEVVDRRVLRLFGTRQMRGGGGEVGERTIPRASSASTFICSSRPLTSSYPASGGSNGTRISFLLPRDFVVYVRLMPYQPP